MRFSTLLFLIISFSALSQERRLALVIGNSNYEKGPLQNPVNDALLMKETFEKLGFEVRLETDIETHNEFYQIISDYNKNRENYKVDFVYYAGHAVQIDGKNYMLATKENYESASDVKYKGIDIDIFTDGFGDPIENEINVLILDACRDNPFEKNIYGSARGTFDNGLGLAEIKNPPLGSLIAFSTAKGETAKDQVNESKNSFYCQSLSKNLMLEGVSLHNVFGKVCAEVYYETKQYPEVYDKMMGKDFYLKKTNFTDQIIEIDSLIDVENYSLAREKTSSILTLDPNNKQALLRKGRIEYNTEGEQYDATEIKKAIQLYPSDPEVYEFMARYYLTIKKFENAFIEINKAIELDSVIPQYYYWRAICHSNLGNTDAAMLDYSSVIRLAPNDPKGFTDRGFFLLNNKKDVKNALDDFTKAIELEPKNLKNWYNRGRLYFDDIKDPKKALDDYLEALKIDSTSIKTINSIGVIHQKNGNLDLAIAQYEKGIALEKTAPESAAFSLNNRALIFDKQGKFEEAYLDYSKAIRLDAYNPERYTKRGLFLQHSMNDFNGALIDFSKALELDSSNIEFWYNRGRLYSDQLNNSKLALNDYQAALKIDPTSIKIINSIGVVHQKKGNTDLAIAQYEKGIALEKTAPESAAFCYSNRAIIYSKQGKFDEANKDFSKAIELEPNNPERYIKRGIFFRTSKKDNNSALRDFSIAIELSPKSTDYYYVRGYHYFYFLKNTSKALEDFEKILDLDSSNIDAINSIGVIYENQGNLEAAILQYEKGISLEKLYPQSASICFSNRAKVFSKLGRYSDALLDYSKSIELDPKNPIRYKSRAIFLENVLNKPYEALTDLTLALYLDSFNLDSWHKRSLLFSNSLDDQSSAISDCQHIIKIDSNNVIILNWIGIYYHRLGMLTEATKYYDLVISKVGLHFRDSVNAYSEGISWAYNNRAIIFQRTKDFSKPLEYYSQAIKYDPNKGLRYFWRGAYYNDYLKDYKNALFDIEHALKLEPENPRYLLYRAKINMNNGNADVARKDYDKTIKISNNHPMYIAHRGNYYRQLKEFERAEKDIENALKSDSAYPKMYHYQILLLKDQNLIEEAISVGKTAASKFGNDTTTHFLLGQIYFEKKDYLKSIKHYQEAISIMEFNLAYQSFGPDYYPVFLSDCYAKLGDIYVILNDKELVCENYRNAIIALVDETRPDKIELEKILQEKISQHCK